MIGCGKVGNQSSLLVRRIDVQNITMRYACAIQFCVPGVLHLQRSAGNVAAIFREEALDIEAVDGAATIAAAPEGPQARSATGPSGRTRASARVASGLGRKDGTKPAPYFAFHLIRSGWSPGTSPLASADMNLDTTGYPY